MHAIYSLQRPSHKYLQPSPYPITVFNSYALSAISPSNQPLPLLPLSGPLEETLGKIVGAILTKAPK